MCGRRIAGGFFGFCEGVLPDLLIDATLEEKANGPRSTCAAQQRQMQVWAVGQLPSHAIIFQWPT